MTETNKPNKNRIITISLSTPKKPTCSDTGWATLEQMSTREGVEEETIHWHDLQQRGKQ